MRRRVNYAEASLSLPMTQGRTKAILTRVEPRSRDAYISIIAANASSTYPTPGSRMLAPTICSRNIPCAEMDIHPATVSPENELLQSLTQSYLSRGVTFIHAVGNQADCYIVLRKKEPSCLVKQETLRCSTRKQHYVMINSPCAIVPLKPKELSRPDSRQVYSTSRRSDDFVLSSERPSTSTGI